MNVTKISCKASISGKTSQSAQQGFTLIEVMVVVVILGILAAMIVPNIVGKDDQARATTTRTGIGTVVQAIEQFKLDNMRYPRQEEGLKALVEKPADAKVWPEQGYLNKFPQDAWGNDMQYLTPGPNGRRYEVLSYGADAQEGGSGFDADISSSDQ